MVDLALAMDNYVVAREKLWGLGISARLFRRGSYKSALRDYDSASWRLRSAFRLAMDHGISGNEAEKSTGRGALSSATGKIVTDEEVKMLLKGMERCKDVLPSS